MERQHIGVPSNSAHCGWRKRLHLHIRAYDRFVWSLVVLSLSTVGWHVKNNSNIYNIQPSRKQRKPPCEFGKRWRQRVQTKRYVKQKKWIALKHDTMKWPMDSSQLAPTIQDNIAKWIRARSCSKWFVEQIADEWRAIHRQSSYQR